METAALFALARETAERAHSPYSGFKVGAALLTESDGLFTGCNVENASYGLTICAERSAIFHAVSVEGSAMRIKAMAVIALGHEFPPCGACRQVIAEIAPPDTKIWLLQGGEPVGLSASNLLPAAFRL